MCQHHVHARTLDTLDTPTAFGTRIVQKLNGAHASIPVHTYCTALYCTSYAWSILYRVLEVRYWRLTNVRVATHQAGIWPWW